MIPYIYLETIRHVISDLTLLFVYQFRFHDYKGIWYLLYTGAIVIMYPSLVEVAQLKFQDSKLSPFETHSFFAYTVIVAYTIAIPTSMILFYMRIRLETSIKECFSLNNYMYKILKNVLYFSGILAPLSLVLVLIIPHGYKWIGYSTIASLFVIIVACNLSDYIKLLCKKSVAKLGVLRRDETSPCSIVSISE